MVHEMLIRAARGQLFRRAFLEAHSHNRPRTALTWDKNLDLIVEYGE